MPNHDATDLLFVYGTLMSTSGGELGRDMRARLAREASVIGPATINARLFDLGRYPGLVEAGSTDSIVHGELIQLHAAAATLAWLDIYEGIEPGHERLGEYERVSRTVALANGSLQSAWVYLYRADVARARPVPDGRWRSGG